MICPVENNYRGFVEMHELQIAEQVLNKAENERRNNNWAGIDEIGLRIGGLSGVNIDSLEFSFTCLTDGTDWQKTKLKIETVPVCVRCHKCQKEFEISGFNFLCPDCNLADVEILRGEELEICYFIKSEDNP